MFLSLGGLRVGVVLFSWYLSLEYFLSLMVSLVLAQKVILIA